MEWGLGLGGSQSAQVRQELSVAPHASRCLPPLALSPSCCRGPRQAPWEHHNPPFRSLPSPKEFSHLSWFIFCSDVCSPHAHLRPHPQKTQKTKRKTGVHWGAERPSWASSPA